MKIKVGGDQYSKWISFVNKDNMQIGPDARIDREDMKMTFSWPTYGPKDPQFTLKFMGLLGILLSIQPLFDQDFDAVKPGVYSLSDLVPGATMTWEDM